jgi:hypothetical protein
MATRAHQKLPFALIQEFTVASGQVVTEGLSVKFASADDECQNCGAGEDGFGVALQSGVAGGKVSIALDGNAIVRVKVGTAGTATRGLYAITNATGHTNQAIADGTTVRYIRGKFMQSGVAGDIVGMLTGITTPKSTA